jgi:thiol-disulfide isomerase/thioredoxin
MDERSAAVWKLRLAALGLGIFTLIIVFAIALKFSNDLRLIYTNGAILLFCGAVWLGRKREDSVAAVFLLAPLVAIFSYEVLAKIPSLWPNLVLWVVAGAIGLVFLRTFRKQTGVAITLIVLLLILSAWYCGSYAPKQLANSFNRIKDTSAPAFVLQPISDGSVPVTPRPGRILVVDFFSTTCAPCIAELPEFAAARTEAGHNEDIDFVLVASDRGRDTPEQFRSFVERRHISMPLAFDVGGKAHDSLGLRGVPAIVVFDRTGKIRLTREGYNSAETGFRHDLVEFLKTL